MRGVARWRGIGACHLERRARPGSACAPSIAVQGSGREHLNRPRRGSDRPSRVDSARPAVDSEPNAPDGLDPVEPHVEGRDLGQTVVQHDRGMDRIASGDVLAVAEQIAGAVGVGEIDRKDDGADGDEEIVNLPGEIEAAQSVER